VLDYDMTDCVDEASVRQILLKAKPDAFVSMMQVDQIFIYLSLPMFYLYLPLLSCCI